MFKKLMIAAAMLGMSASAYAVPSLQVGDGSSGDWEWDSGSETWITSSTSGSLQLTALGAESEGHTAWASSSLEASLQAYLVVSAVPGQGIDVTDAFDISFSGSPSLAPSGESGWGAPPDVDATATEDTDDVPGHGIFPTYWESYVFTFSSTMTEVCNVDPDDSADCTQGYLAMVDFTIISLIEGVTGLHFDLFTVDASGNMYRVNPPSHDAEYRVPEPATLALFGLGLIGFGMARRRKS